MYTSEKHACELLVQFNSNASYADSGATPLWKVQCDGIQSC